MVRHHWYGSSGRRALCGATCARCKGDVRNARVLLRRWAMVALRLSAG
ncbi:hypothetical protein V6Z12_D03G123400 [Gossypium hirsutum]